MFYDVNIKLNFNPELLDVRSPDELRTVVELVRLALEEVFDPSDFVVLAKPMEWKVLGTVSGRISSDKPAITEVDREK
jgi:hypothetical protein